MFLVELMRPILDCRQLKLMVKWRCYFDVFLELKIQRGNFIQKEMKFKDDMVYGHPRKKARNLLPRI